MSTFSSPLLYVQCDIPEGMTLAAWRTSRSPSAATVTPLSSVVRRARRVRRRAGR